MNQHVPPPAPPDPPPQAVDVPRAQVDAIRCLIDIITSRTRAMTWPISTCAWLLDQALDRKREILTIPLPDGDDDSPDAARIRSLILAAADSTISQTIALRSDALAAAKDNRDAELEQFIE